jgi:pimeloyl-ACP methyl ester carboxylesterase
MFKFLERKEKNYLVLIPGWAFDYRIFYTLDLPYNYLFFSNKYVLDFENSLSAVLRKNNIERVSFFGWSQGAFLACDFAGKNPDIVNEIILVSIRKQYRKEALENIKEYLKKNRISYLYKFYRECFCKQEINSLSWFKKNFLKYYLQNTELENLISNLNWLSHVQIKPESLKKIRRIKIVHGRNDKIAPLREAIEIKDNLPRAKLIIFEDTGHLPFLRSNFKERLFYE